jgi:hypothetical protein
MNGIHDMGDMHGFGPVPVDDDARLLVLVTIVIMGRVTTTSTVTTRRRTRIPDPESGRYSRCSSKT